MFFFSPSLTLLKGSPSPQTNTFTSQTAKIAANCCRSLLLQPKPTAADQSMARYLLPRLISFVTNTDSEDPERARPLVAQTLTSYVAAAVSRDHAPVAMALVVPTLLARAAGEDGDAVYRETSARLLELAGVDQAAFRAVVASMSDAQKAFMEEVIRSGRQTGPAVQDEVVGQPTIALKMDFGG